MTPSQTSSFYDDINIDPFFKYGDLDADLGTFHQPTEDVLASDRLFHPAVYDGDFLLDKMS